MEFAMFSAARALAVLLLLLPFSPAVAQDPQVTPTQAITPVPLESEASDYDEVLRVALRVDADLLAWLARRVQCDHFAGEDRYDQERSDEIDGHLERLRCAALDSEELELRKALSEEPDALGLIDYAKAGFSG
ncbi:hypothetical protein [Brevundimonas sp.]|uniref:hypothetical protein n=1 Tax=Brevundimonas sp. TaxID=1871086 RepID=UPI0026075223|nr:hypothetical protein [Brevundimonas sp.]